MGVWADESRDQAADFPPQHPGMDRFRDRLAPILAMGERKILLDPHKPFVQSSLTNAILRVRSWFRMDSGRGRRRAAATFGGAPSHSTNVRQSPLSASTKRVVRA